MVVTITHTQPLPLASQASYELYNGGSAVSMDSSGDLTVSAPTDIRIVIRGTDGASYNPVGASFRQAGITDPNGAINFRTQNSENQVLVIHDDDQLPDTTYLYHLVFVGPDGQLHVLGS